MHRYGFVIQTVDGDAESDLLAQIFPGWLQFPGYRIVVAVLVIAAGIWLSKLLVRLLGRPIARQFARQSVAQTVLGGIRGLTIGGSVIVAGSLVGLGVGNVVLWWVSFRQSSVLFSHLLSPTSSTGFLYSLISRSRSAI